MRLGYILGLGYVKTLLGRALRLGQARGPTNFKIKVNEKLFIFIHIFTQLQSMR